MENENKENLNDWQGTDNQENKDAPENNEWGKAQDKDYKSMYENMQKALKEEREQRKKVSSEAEDLKKFKADLDEKEKKKKWQYEELLSEKETLITQLSEKAKNWDDYLTDKQLKMKERLETIEKSYPKELSEKFWSIISRLDEEWKLEFYETSIKEFEEIKKNWSYKSTPEWDWKWSFDKYNQAKWKRSIWDMIANAPVIK